MWQKLVHRNPECFNRHTEIFFVQKVNLGNGPYIVAQYFYLCYIKIWWLEQILMTVSYENIVFCCENLIDITTKYVGQRSSYWEADHYAASKKFLTFQGIRVPDHDSLPLDLVLSNMNPFCITAPGFLKFPGPERLVVMSVWHTVEWRAAFAYCMIKQLLPFIEFKCGTWSSAFLALLVKVPILSGKRCNFYLMVDFYGGFSSPNTVWFIKLGSLFCCLKNSGFLCSWLQFVNQISRFCTIVLIGCGSAFFSLPFRLLYKHFCTTNSILWP